MLFYISMNMLFLHWQVFFGYFLVLIGLLTSVISSYLINLRKIGKCYSLDPPFLGHL